MSAAVKIAEDRIWWTSNWIFRQLMNDAKSHCLDDKDMAERLGQTSTILFTQIHDADPSDARLIRIIYTVAKGIIQRTLEVGGPPEPGDPVVLPGSDFDHNYRYSLRSLVDLLDVDGRFNDSTERARLG